MSRLDFLMHAGRRQNLRDRTNPILPATTAQAALVPPTISESVNISAAIAIRNATTGLSKMSAVITDPTA